MNLGWIGSRKEIETILKFLGADKDANGKFILLGNIGAGEEFVIGPEVEYHKDGKNYNLAQAISRTSYGRNCIEVF